MASRVATDHVKRSRGLKAAKSAVMTVGRSVGRALHELWLEMIGLVFLLMAASGAVAATHEFAKYRAAHTGVGRVVAAICFTVMFGWFGVSSFWRVRRKRAR